MNVNIIDIICIFTVLIFAVYGYCKGLMKFVFRLAVAVFSALGSRIASIPFTDFIYNSILKDKITVQLYKYLPSGSIGGGINSVINTITSALPEPAIKIADFLHLLPENGAAISDEILTVAQIETDYIRPIVTKVVLIITTLAIFVALVVILNVVVSLINKKFFEEKHGVISTVNRMLGGVFGIVRGVVPVAFICTIIILIAPLIGNESLTASVDGSFVCRVITKIF